MDQPIKYFVIPVFLNRMNQRCNFNKIRTGTSNNGNFHIRRDQYSLIERTYKRVYTNPKDENNNENIYFISYLSIRYSLNFGTFDTISSIQHDMMKEAALQT